MAHEHTRRSILGVLAATGVLDASTAAVTAGREDTTVVGKPNLASQDEAVPLTETAPPSELLGVELIERDTGRGAVYRDVTAVDRTQLPAGQYEVVELRRGAAGIEPGRVLETISVDGVGMQEETEISLGVLTETGATYGHVPTDGEVAVQVGAIERESGVARGPAADVDVEVELADPAGSTVETQTASTSDRGEVRLTFDLDGVDPGRYTVEVRSDAAESVNTDRLRVGPYTALPFHGTAMTVGEQTTLGVFSAVGGTPDEGVTREISVSGPDGSQETLDVDIGSGGIGLFQFTPDQSGSYDFTGLESPAFDSTIEAGGETKAFALLNLRDQFFDDGQETMTWGALVVENGTPAANRDVDVTVLERKFGESDEVIAEFTPTTNDLGLFTVEFEKPDESFQDYRVEIQTTAGEDVFLDNDTVFFSSVSDPDPPAFRLSLDSREVAPGQTVTVDGKLVDEGTPVAEETVSLLLAYQSRFAGQGSVPVEVVETETGSDGSVATSVDVPADAPDGEGFEILGSVDLGGELREARATAEIQTYAVEVDAFDLSRGETNAVDVTVTDRQTDDPVSGIDVTLFGNRDHVDTETFDAGYTSTDASGQGTIDLTVPMDATNRVMSRDFGPYRGANSGLVSSLEPFGVETEGTPESPTVGETVTLSYTADTPEQTAAFVVFPNSLAGSLRLIREDETAAFDVPAYLEGRDFVGAQFLVVAANGDVTRGFQSFSLGGGLSAGFQFTPAEPQPGQSVEFEDTSSSGPETTIESYEWAFGDGATATGQQVTHSYDSTGEFTASLTVTTAAGDSDTATKTVPVTEAGGGPPAVVGDNPPSDPDGDDLYEDVDGDGEFTVGDVRQLFDNRQASVVQNNAEFFNFSGTGTDEVTLRDVEVLYSLLEEDQNGE